MANGTLLVSTTEHQRLSKLQQQAKGLGLRAFRMPGRIEIIGNHTDHNSGNVIAASVDVNMLAVVKATNQHHISITSNNQSFNVPVKRTISQNASQSEMLVHSIVIQLLERGVSLVPCEVWIDSTIPIGRGLSSSAGFCMLVLEILCTLSQHSLSLIQKAHIAKMAEFAISKPCGLMDQLACAHGGIIAIDFMNEEMPEIQEVTMPDSHYALAITATGSSHEDLHHHYASIPQDMALVCEYFSVTSLRSLAEDQLYGNLAAMRNSGIPDRAIMRAMHFFAENKRVDMALHALIQNDMPKFLQCVQASGISSWQLLQNVVVENSTKQDLACMLAASHHFLQPYGGVCRIHGGGFFGSLLAVLPRAHLPEYIEAMESILGKHCTTELSVDGKGVAELAL